jgi:hypothetical protein
MSAPPPPPPRLRVLLCASGSVAAVKLAELVLALRAFAEVRVVITARAAHFIDLGPEYDAGAWAAYAALTPPVEVLRDAQEWESYTRVGSDAVLHIEVSAGGGWEESRGVR